MRDARLCAAYSASSTRPAPSDEDQVRELTDLVAHRGPDGRARTSTATVGLGHRRLAIIDLTNDGTQPMRHRRHPLWITYNGEIYNTSSCARSFRPGRSFSHRHGYRSLANAYDLGREVSRTLQRHVVVCDP